MRGAGESVNRRQSLSRTEAKTIATQSSATRRSSIRRSAGGLIKAERTTSMQQKMTRNNKLSPTALAAAERRNSPLLDHSGMKPTSRFNRYRVDHSGCKICYMSRCFLAMAVRSCVTAFPPTHKRCTGWLRTDWEFRARKPPQSSWYTAARWRIAAARSSWTAGRCIAATEVMAKIPILVRSKGSKLSSATGCHCWRLGKYLDFGPLGCINLHVSTNEITIVRTCSTYDC